MSTDDQPASLLSEKEWTAQDHATEARWALRVPFNAENTKHNEGMILKAINAATASLRLELEQAREALRRCHSLLVEDGHCFVDEDIDDACPACIGLAASPRPKT